MKKPLLTYGFEFLGVFLAVFLGSLAENYRENLQERNRGRDFAERLVADIQNDSIRAELAFINAREKNYELLLIADLHDANLDDPAVQSEFNKRWRNATIWRRVAFEPNVTTLSQIENVGGWSFLHQDAIGPINTYQFIIADANRVKDQMEISRDKVMETLRKLTDIMQSYEDRSTKFINDPEIRMLFFNQLKNYADIVEGYAWSPLRHQLNTGYRTRKKLAELYDLDAPSPSDHKINVVGSASLDKVLVMELVDHEKRRWKLEAELEPGELFFVINNTQMRWGGFGFPAGMARPEKQAIVVPSGGRYVISFDYYASKYSFEEADLE